MTMRLKPTYQNHLKDWVKGSIMLYSILVVVFLISVIFVAINVSDTGDSTFSGMEFVSQIFILVVGISAFKPNLKLALANGISRKTEFTVAILAAATVAVAFNFLNIGINLLYGTMYPVQSEFSLAFGDYAFANSFVYYLTGFIYNVVGLISDFILGYFIGALYYRMPKWLKILVSVGVPVLAFIGIPIVSATVYMNGSSATKTFLETIIAFFAKIAVEIFSNPLSTILTSIGFSILFGIFSFLLIRRAPIKEQG